MKTFYLSLPRMNVSLSLSESIAPRVVPAFANMLVQHEISPIHVRYRIVQRPNGFALSKNDELLAVSGNPLGLSFTLENDLELSLMKYIGDWVSFHAGGVAVQESGCLIVGTPDSGKTTTTFILAEMGHTFLCEEIAPVDPETGVIHPFPLALTMSQSFMEEYRSVYPIHEGTLIHQMPGVGRYSPRRFSRAPVRLKTMLIPSYHRDSTPQLVPQTPGEALTEILSFCFPPNTEEEYHFDSVIRILERCSIYRLCTNGISETRQLLNQIFAGDS